MKKINGKEYNTKAEFEAWAEENKVSRDGLQVVYNEIPGAPPQKRLRNRPTAIDAIWAASRAWVSTEEKPAKRTRDKESTGKRGKVTAAVLDILKAGATGKAIQQLTGWLPHSVRGFISTQRSKGLCITTEKVGKETVYTVS